MQKVIKVCLPDTPIEHNWMATRLKDLGFDVTDQPEDDVDVIYNSAGFKYAMIYKKIGRLLGKVPMINWVWDFYQWAWEDKRGDSNFWKEYGKFLQMTSSKILVPNKGTQMRIKEYLDMDSEVMYPGWNGFENLADPIMHKGGDYVLDHQRDYPEINFKIAEKAGEELGIPVVRTQHKLPMGDFKEKMYNCRFMVSPYYEASTGGMPNLEGLWHGIPVLASNSEYNGVSEYCDDFAVYFQWDDYEDLKKKMKEMWENPPKIDVKKAREYIYNFSWSKGAERLAQHLCI